jgi:hypothetical protein
VRLIRLPHEGEQGADENVGKVAELPRKYTSFNVVIFSVWVHISWPCLASIQVARSVLHMLL